MTDNSSNISVIILAGGSGARTELKTPKQYVEIGEKRVIEYSLNTLLEFTSDVIIVVPDPKEWEGLNIDLPVKVVQGGSTRTQSLLNGLQMINTGKVLIHDASRPIIPKDIVENIISNLDNYACVYPVLPIRSTIVAEEDGFLSSTPDRSKLKEIQTPQGFQTKWIAKALEEKSDASVHIPELIRLIGQKVKHIEGSPWLFKITYEADIYAAHVYIENLRINEDERMVNEAEKHTTYST